ncbi:ATP-dependent helicase HrpA [Mycobacteroides abscessus]|nr:ATP-dependent helicase HrpA [Mycobacteroides abscessus]
MRRAEKVVQAWSELQVALPTKAPAAQSEAIADMRDQLDRLLDAGFVAATGAARLTDLARYVNAIGKRLERLPQGAEADRERMHRVHAVEDAYDDLLRDLPAGRADDPDIRDIAWFIEELRVSLWAQQLGTARAVSEQRILKAINAAR